MTSGSEFQRGYEREKATWARAVDAEQAEYRRAIAINKARARVVEAAKAWRKLEEWSEQSLKNAVDELERLEGETKP